MQDLEYFYTVVLLLLPKYNQYVILESVIYHLGRRVKVVSPSQKKLNKTSKVW